jgi:hypothetical protein
VLEIVSLRKNLLMCTTAEGDSNIVRMIETRKLRRAGHVARMGEMCVQGFSRETWGKETSWKTEEFMLG